jgi:hypothetical protein
MWLASSGCGLRSFLSFVNQRLSTLKRIVPMVSKSTGNGAEKERQYGFLMGKFISAMIDTLFVLFGSVLPSASMVFLGSTFNSHMFAIHVLIFGGALAAVYSVSNIRLHFKLNKARRKSDLIFISQRETNMPGGESVAMASDV